MSRPDVTGWNDSAGDESSWQAAGTTYLCRGWRAATDWHTNLLANANLTFHLKNGIRADLPSRATPFTDPTERQAVLVQIVADLTSPTTPAPSGRLGSRTGLTVA
ncbi:hypothetical protein ACI3EY_02360 [Ornithinimicrobium sp. LYQ92]|uniref:hypothetical protein n=1 Tax=Serinicoccus sp. LYQ92 TaxID=3378798 RepID=UPI003852733B